MQIIFTGRDLTEAHIVAGMLRAEGIEAHVGGHYLQGAVGDLAPMDFARVLVDSTDTERATDLIREYNRGRDNEPAEPDVEHSGDDAGNLAWAGWLLLGILFLFLLRWAL